MKAIYSIALLLIIALSAEVASASDELPFPIPAGLRPILRGIIGPEIDMPQGCPVTLPNGYRPIGADDNYDDFNLGNEARTLFTIPWPDGVVVFDRGGGAGFWGEDGSLSMKWPWYRSVEGDITIEGRRLDGDAPSVWAEIPDGYGDSGFQPMGLVFPTVGCWEVIGRVGDESLTFVTLVIEVPSYFETHPVN